MGRGIGHICLTSKLRGQDAVCVKNETKKVDLFIQSNPLDLWNAIHTTGSNISLVRTTYDLLKKAVEKINPTLVEKVNKEHDSHKARRKLSKEMNTGALGTSKSSFKKLN
jgi:hypothetical protein